MRRWTLWLALGACVDAGRSFDLAEWVGKLTLLVPQGYDNKILGVDFQVKDIECEQLRIGSIAAGYDPSSPTSLALDLDGLEADCRGDYKWKFKSFLGSVSGDGRVDIAVERSRLEVTVEIGTDAAGAPTAAFVSECKVDLVLDVDLRGDPIGAAANLVIDAFSRFFVDDIEKVVCDSFKRFLDLDLAPLIRNAGLGKCTAAGPSRTNAGNNVSAQWTRWPTFLANATGRGASLARTLNRARKNANHNGGDGLAGAFDVAAYYDAALVTAAPLVFDGPFVAGSRASAPQNASVLANATASISGIVVQSSVPLSTIRAEDLRAAVDAPGGAAMRLSATLPESLRFDASANLSVGLAVGDLGESFEQGLRSPFLRFQAVGHVSLSALSAKMDVVLGMVAQNTKAGVANLLVGDMISADCLLAALAVDDVSIESFSLRSNRSKVVLSQTRFIPRGGEADTYLEDDIASSVIPAVVELIDSGFRDFLSCALDETLNATATGHGTAAARDALGTSTAPEKKARLARACDQRRDWRADWDLRNGPSLVALNATNLVRRLARELGSLDGTSLLRDAAVYVADERDRVVVFESASLRIPALDASLHVEEVFVGNVAAALSDVQLFPGGAQSLRRRGADIVDVTAGYAAPVVVGAKMTFRSPVGRGRLDVNVSLSRVRLSNVGASAWLDRTALNAQLGAELGLSELFSRRGQARGVACVVSAFQAVSLEHAPKLHVGSVRAAASSDVDNLGKVIVDALEAVAGFVGEFVDAENARAEATWLANDAIDAALTSARARCESANEDVPVAARRDERGERPTATRDDASGVDGAVAAGLESLAVLGLLVGTFFSTWLLSLRAKPAAARLAPGAERSLFQASAAPMWFKVLVVCVMVGNACLLVSSNVAIAAEVRVRLQFDLEDVGARELYIDTDSKFSLAESVIALWRAESYLLAVLICALSGAWPYLELTLLLWGFLAPNARQKRERVWRTVEVLSKWSFIDVFIVVFLIVAMHVWFEIETHEASFRFDIFVEARYGFYAFLIATLVSMCLGQVVLGLHRKNNAAQNAPHGAAKRHDDAPETPGTPSECTSDKGAPFQSAAAAAADDAADDADAADSTNDAAADAATDVEADASADFVRRCSLASHWREGALPGRAVGFGIFAVGVFLAAAFTITVVEFEIGGALGFAMDVTGSESDQKYAAAGMALALPSSTPRDGWRPAVRALAAATVVFAMAMPLAHVTLLAALWIAPLEAAQQVQLLALSDVAFGWSSLDVYLVAIIATATQISDIVASFAERSCERVDGFLEAFFDSALSGDATCLRVAVRVRPGAVALAAACCAHLLLGYLAAGITANAVAERAAAHALRLRRAEPPLGSAGDSGGAIELVAIELVPKGTDA
ncbi:hypothetical protein M885DRAFT_619209 [Pelagophyceae sp. CCMP2097]|nr:hypothetical protein M885DRAFT_619209 [Pelagophyceae sp. CCMP2097]